MSDLTKKKAEALFTGAMNIFNSPGGNKQSAPAPTLDSKASKSSMMENNPEDIPKEDLLHLCMKMNKRMQSMETKGQELNKRRTLLLSERRQLLDAIRIRVIIPAYPADDQELDTGLIVELMNKSDVHQREIIASLEKRVTNLDQLRMHEALVSDAKHRREILDLQIALSTAASTSSAANSTTSFSPSESDTKESKEPHPPVFMELIRADSQVLMLSVNEKLTKEKDVRTQISLPLICTTQSQISYHLFFLIFLLFSYLKYCSDS